MKRYFLGLGFTLFAVSAWADPPSPTVQVVNDTTNPVPVSVIAAPDTTVLCYADLGGGGSTGPYEGGGSAGSPASSFTCPPGVTAIKVQRMAVALEGLHTALFRITVGFTDDFANKPTDPAGFLGMMTTGAPQVPVAQPFVLDTADTSPRFWSTEQYFAGIDSPDSLENSVTLFLIGTPIQ